MTLPLTLKKLFGKGAARGPSPERDWRLLLIAMFALLAASVAWNAWFFERATSVAPGASSEGGGALDTYPAGAIEGLFRARAENEEAYRSSFRFVDPARRGE